MRTPQKLTMQAALSLGVAAVVSVIWFISTGLVALALDQDKPPESLETVYRILTFPARCLPEWESWDPRYSTMAFREWCRYSNLGDVLNALLWGTILASLFFVVLRAFTAGADKSRESAA
jgi:hypothetical protein